MNGDVRSEKMKALTAITSLALLILIANALITWNRKGPNWAEGRMTRSPDNRWLVLKRTTSTPVPEDSFINLLVFDTDLYPNLKEEKATPSRTQRKNPRASYVIPAQMYARVTTFRWDADRPVVDISQGRVNMLEPLAYRLDLDSFSLMRIEN